MPATNLIVATAQMKLHSMLEMCCVMAIVGAAVCARAEWPEWDPPVVDPRTGRNEELWMGTCVYSPIGRGEYSWVMYDYCANFTRAQNGALLLFMTTSVKHAVIWLSCAAFAKLTALMAVASAR
jgi:hypothetical protein